MKQIKIGIIGLGSYAKVVAETINTIPDITIYAVASRDIERAKIFAKEFNVLYAFGSYEELLANKEIDLVYIATTHNHHYENMILALKWDKNILCEKPFTINSSQAEEIFSIARRKKLFVMEAMKFKFLPAIQETKKLIEFGEIGEIKSVFASRGYNYSDRFRARFHKKEEQGGALLRIGIYPIAFALTFLGASPKVIESVVSYSEDELDDNETIILKYDNGTIATLISSINCYLNEDAVISGTKGKIIIPDFFDSKEIILHKYKEFNRTDERKIFFKTDNNAIATTFLYVADCLRNNKIYSDLHPANECIKAVYIMEQVKKRWDKNSEKY